MIGKKVLDKEWNHIITAEDLDKCRIDGWIHLPSILIESGACETKTEARRLIKAGAVEIDGCIEDVSSRIPIRDGAILKVGKHFWRRLRIIS